MLLRPQEEFHVAIRLDFAEGDVGIHQAIVLVTLITHVERPPPVTVGMERTGGGLTAGGSPAHDHAFP